MSRRLAAILVLASGTAVAQPIPDTPPPPGGEPARGQEPATPTRPPDDAPEPTPAPAPEPPTTTTTATAPEHSDIDIGDQLLAAQIGLATGGRDTPGGLRVAGHYLYQLTDRDWFDGTAAFTFGAGHAACFRDRMNTLVCDHGLADGDGVEIAANVRRMFSPQGMFQPYAGVGLGLGLVRFGSDDVSGIAIPLHASGGVRAAVSDAIAVVAEAQLALGFAKFNHTLGTEPQLGLSITAGAEFRLK